jgi:hypothetical protein
MRLFLLSLPTKLQALVVVGTTVTLAFLIAYICSLFFDVHQLKLNTDLISSVYQVMGTIYAILLTFTLWGIWQNFTDAEIAVQKEAYALLDLVHTLEAVTVWKAINVRGVALSYVNSVLKDEWPTLKSMNKHIIDVREQNAASLEVIKEIQNIQPTNDRENVIFGQAFNLLNSWLDSRRTRLLIASGDSAKSLWPLLLTGAFVLFSIHGLFVANTVGIWATLLFGISLVIGLTFYLIYTLDCPFSGSPSIDAEPFHLAIAILMKKPVG